MKVSSRVASSIKSRGKKAGIRRREKKDGASETIYYAWTWQHLRSGGIFTMAQIEIDI
jgi:hypothetical protein